VPLNPGQYIDLNGKYYMITFKEGEAVKKISLTVSAGSRVSQKLNEFVEENVIYEFTKVAVDGDLPVRIEYPAGVPRLSTKEVTELSWDVAPKYAPLELEDFITEPSDAPTLVSTNTGTASKTVDVYLWFYKYVVVPVSKADFDKAPYYLKRIIRSKR